jgi:hypothetical protein
VVLRGTPPRPAQRATEGSGRLVIPLPSARTFPTRSGARSLGSHWETLALERDAAPRRWRNSWGKWFDFGGWEPQCRGNHYGLTLLVRRRPSPSRDGKKERLDPGEGKFTTTTRDQGTLGICIDSLTRRDDEIWLVRAMPGCGGGPAGVAVRKTWQARSGGGRGWSIRPLGIRGCRMPSVYNPREGALTANPPGGGTSIIVAGNVGRGNGER